MFDFSSSKIVSAIKSWKPTKQYTKENDYRNDLANHIRNQFNNDVFGENIHVSKESGRELCDIAINEKQCGIELKKDLKSKSQIDRLVGQINRYQKEYNTVIVVLVGKTNPDSLDELKIQLKGFGNSMFSETIKIIDKGNKTTPSKSRAKNRNFEDPFDFDLF
jgi:hypothetical protein